MGTNYYLTKERNYCHHCGRKDVETKHIGKSSSGWVFSLHVYPEEGIHDLSDWTKKFPDGKITNDYGHSIPVLHALLYCKTNR